MGGRMSHNRTRLVILSATVAFLAACGGSQLIPATSLFGPTMTKAFARSTTDAPLTSAEIQNLAEERPLSLTTDPIDI